MSWQKIENTKKVLKRKKEANQMPFTFKAHFTNGPPLDGFCLFRPGPKNKFAKLFAAQKL